MSRTASLALRLAALTFVGVLVQAAGLSQIDVLGVSVDLAPLIVAFAGLVAGSVTGAITGFAYGLLTDLVLVQTLGISSLLLVGVGYAAGRLHELRDPHHSLVPLAVGALAAFLFATGATLIHLMLGVDAPLTWGVLRDILAVTVVDAVVALPVHAFVRRVLAGALPEDTRRRRRRAYTTGGLSPLTTSGSR